MPLLAWPTVRWLPVTIPRGRGRLSPPLRFYAAALIRPGVRALLAAEVLWVIGYAALPVFFILYARRVLDLDTARASLWLAAFAVAAGAVMAAAGFVRRPRLHKPFLGLGVLLMGRASSPLRLSRASFGFRSHAHRRQSASGSSRHSASPSSPP